MPEVLTGLGVAGLVAVYGLATLFCLVQPIWALVDCVDSERDRETKILVSIAIFFTWGIGSLIYGIFFAVSSNLRKFTVIASIVLLGITVLSFGSCVSGFAQLAKQSAAIAEQEQDAALERAAAFDPPRVATDAVAPFYAILFNRLGRHSTTTSLARFTLAGPDPSSARDVRGGIRQVAHDPAGGRTFALSQHAFGALSPSTGELIEIAVDPSFEFSWPKGIAWEPESGKVVVMTSHVYTHFYTYDPAISSWEKLPTRLRDVSIAGLTWLPEEQMFYSFAVDAHGTELTHLQRFNRQGSSLGAIALDPPIPLGDGGDTERAQLHHSSGALVAMLPPYDEATMGATDRLFLIDARTGAVSAPATPRSAARAATQSSATTR